MLYPDTPEFDETAWMRAASTKPACDVLHDPAEDIYSIMDGKSFDDQE